MKKSFFVSTPIYYPSGNLHIGHAYTTTLADVIARYKKEQGYDVYFLTGSDEHGQKIELKAKEANQTPKDYVNQIVKTFKTLWKNLNINYDKFIRTDDKDHINAVQEAFSLLLKKDLVYLSNYSGKYCLSCEEFLKTDQMDSAFVHNVCFKTAIDFQEETYMLRVSMFRSYLNDLFKTNFLEPESRKNEMLTSFINNELEDLSITRINFSWGIPVLENKKHVIYVWFDALLSYISALGWGNEDNTLLDKFWTNGEVLQLIGKEITRFHSIYWPILLKSINLKTPDKLLSHGWILSKNIKMSKSIGNIVDPLELIDTYGADALRFYIINNLPTNKDGSFSEELFIESFNTNLANNIGNLISRVTNMIIKYFDGILPKVKIEENHLSKLGNKTIKEYEMLMDNYNMSEAVQVVLKLGSECNKFIEDEKPWSLEKENNQDKLTQILLILQKNIIIIIYLLKPILTDSYDKMIDQMGLKNKNINFDSLKEHNFEFDKIILKDVLYKRIK